MKIKRFFAKDMRTALSQVKESLGADAVIMSNHKTEDGVEIVAAIDVDNDDSGMPISFPKIPPKETLPEKTKGKDLSKIGSTSAFSKVLEQYQSQSQSKPQQDEVVNSDSLVALLKRQEKHLQQTESSERTASDPKPLKFLKKNRNSSCFETQQHNSDTSSKSSTPRLDPSRFEKHQPAHQQKDVEEMKSEMKAIRRLLEHQVSGLMWQEVERREPIRAMMIKRLSDMGVARELAEQLVTYLPENTAPIQAWSVLLELLVEQLSCIDECVLTQGGVVALLGPTGVGKTTTIAKLAAQAAMKFGPEQVAMVTTDTFRIGAHEQLATYGRIMGCPVRVANDRQELTEILHQFRHRQLILLDTAGMGQRDLRLSEQLDCLIKHQNHPIRSFLVLPATAQARVLNETIEHFQRISLSGVILTKLDESLSLGEMIGVVIQYGLPLAYITDGQRVPEDIHIASSSSLVQRANTLFEQNNDHSPHFWVRDESNDQGMDYYHE